MFRHLYQTIRLSRLAQAGVALVVLSAVVQLADDAGAVDLASLPYVGHYAPAIGAALGVAKVVARFAIFIITGLSMQDKK